MSWIFPHVLNNFPKQDFIHVIYHHIAVPYMHLLSHWRIVKFHQFPTNKTTLRVRLCIIFIFILNSLFDINLVVSRSPSVPAHESQLCPSLPNCMSVLVLETGYYGSVYITKSVKATNWGPLSLPLWVVKHFPACYCISSSK